MMLTSTSLDVLLLICLQAIFATASFLPANLTSWFDQSSVIVGDWLYVDSGEVWILTNGSLGSNSAVWNQQTMAFDLSTSWTTDSVTPVLTNKTESVPLARRPDLWYDPIAGMVFSMGGWAYAFGGQWWQDNTPVSLWGFKPQSNGVVEWQEQPWSPKEGAANLSSNIVGGLATSSSKAHYNLGGSIVLQPKVGTDNAQSLQEMVSYNFTDQTWSNQSVPGRYALYGEGQYIEHYGLEGIILFLGGQWSADAAQTMANLKALNTILIYDIQSKKFYEQAASNAPSPRAQFCSVGASSAGNSSYEIFIYGGQEGKGGENPSATIKEDLSSVYILTIPSFTWVKAPNERAAWRAWHTCKTIGNRHMISIGGRQQEKLDDPEPWPNGLGIFDMTTLNWTGSYDTNAQAYTRHSSIESVYTNTLGYPISWSDPALPEIFKVKSNNASSTDATTSSPASTSNDTVATNSNVKIIVPVVLCGAALLVFLIFLILYFIRRSKRQKDMRDEPKINELSEETWKGEEVHADSKSPYGMAQMKINEMPSELAVPPPRYEIDSKAKQEAWELQA